MTQIDINNMRVNYSKGSLALEDTHNDPIVQFNKWFEEAVSSDLPEPNAMTLATVDTDNLPDARIVLLKGVTSTGFIFYTNYLSDKGLQLEQNNNCALVFHWHELQRQVRIRGVASKLDAQSSDQYFQSRPVASQLGAIASDQSKIIASKSILEDRFESLKSEYEGKQIPRPDHWGGYLVLPFQIEFWQGRRSRLHDRIQYTKNESLENEKQWLKQILSP